VRGVSVRSHVAASKRSRSAASSAHSSTLGTPAGGGHLGDVQREHLPDEAGARPVGERHAAAGARHARQLGHTRSGRAANISPNIESTTSKLASA
jgi:hypothetical protein